MSAQRRKHLLFLLLGTASLIASGTIARAAGGDLDETFGEDGTVTTNFSSSLDVARAVVVDDSHIVVGGRAGFAARSFGLARFNADGTLDSTFGGNGRVSTDLTNGGDIVGGLCLQADGYLVASGGAGGKFGLVRYGTDGSLDPDFGDGGIVLTNFRKGQEGAVGVAVHTNGKIVAAGTARSDRFALARYAPDGSLDPTFSGDGKVTTQFRQFDGATASGMAIRTGKVIVVGQVAEIGNGKFALARYRRDGTLDPTFSGDGKVATDLSIGFDVALDVAIQADGRIVVAGSTGEGTSPRFALARYNSDGSLDRTFHHDGKLTTRFRYSDAYAHGVVVDPIGRIIAAGSAGEGGPRSRFALARYDPDGTLDASFGGDGKVTTRFEPTFDFTIAHDVALAPEGKIVAGGGAGGRGGRFAVARYLAD